MNRRFCFLVAVSLSFFVSSPLCAQHSSGGGHGGGHFSSGGFSGHPIGHSMGHSFGHLFEHHSGGHGSRLGKAPGGRGDELPPLAGAAFMHGKVVILPGPSGMTRDSQPRQPGSHRFTAVAGPRKHFRTNHFDGGFCNPFRFTWHNFLFPDDFDCFGDPFFAGPGLSASYELDPSSAALGSSGLVAQGRPSASRQDAESSASSLVKTKQPLTLLQLRDGSMYGLTHYWIKDDRLHYVTDYGGENSVPLNRIDFAKTSQLNTARSTPLILPANEPKP